MCLAIVVASPLLPESRARTIEHLQAEVDRKSSLCRAARFKSALVPTARLAACGRP